MAHKSHDGIHAWIIYLLSENGFGLATKTLLLSVVTPPTLGELGLLRLFVLSHLPLLVIPAHGMLAISHSDLRQVHLKSLKMPYTRFCLLFERNLAKKSRFSASTHLSK